MADKKTIFLTGAAGFIGMHVALALAKRGDRVVGLDNFSDYYDPSLKRKRAALLKQVGVDVIEGDVTDKALMKSSINGATHFVNLAAQAGVRYSLTNPESYLKSNLEGFLVVLELLKNSPEVPLVYASSSSVYGANKKLPFSCADKTDSPTNFYGATKKANELMAHAYHTLYGLNVTGLRYFTVYGPWGRPDMAYFSFTKAISEGKPIKLFNRGQMKRDFTYIDDIVSGTLAAIDRPNGYKVYNLGNHRSEELLYFVELIEKAVGKKAIIELEPMPATEMLETFADIETAQEELGFTPKTSLEEGVFSFVNWYKEHTA